MFSGRIGMPAVGALTLWLAALILIAGLVPEEVCARTSQMPTVQPGDPDEFETRTFELPSMGSGKPAVCGDSSAGEVVTIAGDLQPRVVLADVPSPTGRWEKLTGVVGLLLARFALKIYVI